MFEAKVVKTITRPILKFEKEKALYVRIVSAPFSGSPPPKRAGAAKEPVAPLLVDVATLPDEMLAALPVHSSLKNILDTQYPGNAYVGKCFSITSKTRQPGRQFVPYHVAEIEDPRSMEAADAAASPAPPQSAATSIKRRN
jgi:hypothetical protein